MKALGMYVLGLLFAGQALALPPGFYPTFEQLMKSQYFQLLSSSDKELVTGVHIESADKLEASKDNGMCPALANPAIKSKSAEVIKVTFDFSLWMPATANKQGYSYPASQTIYFLTDGSLKDLKPCATILE